MVPSLPSVCPGPLLCSCKVFPWGLFTSVWGTAALLSVGSEFQTEHSTKHLHLGAPQTLVQTAPQICWWSLGRMAPQSLGGRVQDPGVGSAVPCVVRRGRLAPLFSLTHTPAPLPPADSLLVVAPVQPRAPAHPRATSPEFRRHSWSGCLLPLQLPLVPYPHRVENDLSENISGGATVLLKPSGHPPAPRGDTLDPSPSLSDFALLPVPEPSRSLGCRHTASAAPYPCLTLLPVHLCTCGSQPGDRFTCPPPP